MTELLLLSSTLVETDRLQRGHVNSMMDPAMILVKAIAAAVGTRYTAKFDADREIMTDSNSAEGLTTAIMFPEKGVNKSGGVDPRLRIRPTDLYVSLMSLTMNGTRVPIMLSSNTDNAVKLRQKRDTFRALLPYIPLHRCTHQIEDLHLKSLVEEGSPADSLWPLYSNVSR